MNEATDAELLAEREARREPALQAVIAHLSELPGYLSQLHPATFLYEPPESDGDHRLCLRIEIKWVV